MQLSSSGTYEDLCLMPSLVAEETLSHMVWDFILRLGEVGGDGIFAKKLGGWGGGGMT